MLNFCHQKGQQNFILLARFTHDRATGRVNKTVIYPSDSFPVDSSLAKFSYPYPAISHDTSYSFCLTGQTATPTYGYVILKVDGNNVTSFCLLSQFFYPRDYFAILSKYIENRSVRAVEAQTVRDVDWNDVKPQQVVKEYITFGLSVFGLCDIGRLLIAMLLDSRFVVIGESVERVEKFCYSLLAFVHPLRWPGVFIPVLPAGLEDTLYAPFPYIIGIHSSMVGATQVEEMESHVLVNIDARSYSFERMEIKMPREVQRRIDALPELVREFGIDAAYRQFMIRAVECACKGHLKDPESLVSQYKHEKEKMKVGKMSFKAAVLQSQLVQSLMREVEVGPGGEVFSKFTEKEKTIELKEQPEPKVSAKPAPPSPRKPVRVEKSRIGTLQQIMEMADEFSKRNRNIETKIRAGRAGVRPLSCEATAIGSPEALPFRSRMSIFEQRPVLDGEARGQITKTRTMSEITSPRKK